MNKLLLLLLFVISSCLAGQKSDGEEISRILENQVSSWNKGDIKGFMVGYWQSDSLMFIGKSGITYGWNQTLENYKKNYPDLDAMGKLSFDIKRSESIGPAYWSVIGQWNLDRKADTLSGYFTLLFRRIDDQWVIVSDHSS